MKPSQFNLLTDYQPTGELLAFNTANGALVAFPGELAQSVSDCLNDGPSPDTDPQLLDLLRTHGLLIDESTDEVERVVERNQLGINDPNRLDVFLLPNMNCNFACPYCFEDHRPSRMSAEVEQRIIDWFERMVPQFKVVLLSWFGGEPLLSFTVLLRLQRKVQTICQRAGVVFNSHITTNGYLLDAKRAAALGEAGLFSYQITMDGPPDIHNNSRVLKGPGDSFERIFDNICNLARTDRRANIKLRVNFNPETLRRVPELLRRFPPEIRGQLHLVLERIFGQGTLFIQKSPNQVAHDTEACYELARELGFAITTTPLAPDKLTYCYADRVSQFLFNHEGDVFKCAVSNFTRDERLGYLDERGRVVWDNKRYDDWMAVPALDDDCRSCTYLPMCMGGCRKTRQFTGHASSDCTLPFAALDERVRHRYARQLAGQPEQLEPALSP